MSDLALALVVLAVYVAQYGAKCFKRRLDLPDWSAEQAYMAKFAQWRRRN
jgi:hypothetical protein